MPIRKAETIESGTAADAARMLGYLEVEERVAELAWAQ
jgi:hypothetical protein